jgi:hypothetical protein
MWMEKEAFLYNKQATFGDRQFWYCTSRRTMVCGATLVTDLDCTPLSRRVAHSHDPMTSEVVADKRRRSEKVKLEQHLTADGTRPCCRYNCDTCDAILPGNEFTSMSTGQTFRSAYGVANCKTKNCIYLLTCKTCRMQYVGTTGCMLCQRRQGHRTEVKEWAKGVWEHQGRSIGLHFNNSEAGCKIENTELQVIALEERRGRRLELESGFINLLRPGINGVLLSPMATVDFKQSYILKDTHVECAFKNALWIWSR